MARKRTQPKLQNTLNKVKDKRVTPARNVVASADQNKAATMPSKKDYKRKSKHNKKFFENASSMTFIDFLKETA